MTVLLIEDHEDSRDMYVAALEAAGYDVLAVATSHRAPESVRVIAANLVIMDLGLRDDAFEVASQLAAMPKAPKLIAVTGRPRQGIPAEDVFAEYLVKPILPDELIRAVHRTLAS